jgi:SAM-dependent methyltransferase
MLHHVPTADEQDAVLSELCRALRPGGRLIGSDSLASDALCRFHDGDTYKPVDPATLPVRLAQAGFHAVRVNEDRVLTFTATKPERPAEAPAG